MPNMNCLQFELEIERMARAMMTRNRQIGQDLFAYLKTQIPLEVIAGLTIVSIERILWFDTEAVLWTVEYLIPADVLQEIRKLTTITLYKQLIGKGFIPGKDISVDAEGKLLLNERARSTVACTR
ncbi:hypothetical protein [Aliterella atlantica]|nr:hypothetical protein [Aliterella atlantica]